jgi:hypothetical protein
MMPSPDTSLKASSLDHNNYPLPAIDSKASPDYYHQQHQTFSRLSVVLQIATTPIPPALLVDGVAGATADVNDGNDDDFLNTVEWQDRCIQQLEDWYQQALAMKCPFLRRRASDILDTLDALMRTVVLDEETRNAVVPLAYQCEGKACFKRFGISLTELFHEIHQDWRVDTNKGYYITGRINTQIYRDDCLFHGPDPDMPVRGLRKFLNAASQLFDPAKSTCELLSLTQDEPNRAIVAQWRMRGRLRLPWKPWMPTVTGTTVYRTDATGIIYEHEEEWDISVMRAFVQTLLPDIGRLFWKDDGKSPPRNDVHDASPTSDPEHGH